MPEFGFLVGTSPSPKFAFPRSYVLNLAFTAGGWPMTQADNVFTLVVGSPVVYTEVLELYPNFFEWSSNRYTLDYIVKSIGYFTPGGPLSPAGVGVNWFPNDDPPTPSILFDFVATGSPLRRFSLPPAPPDYWMQAE